MGDLGNILARHSNHSATVWQVQIMGSPQPRETARHPADMSKRNLTCWALSDGRRGMENQALGLAEAVAADGGIAIEVKRAKLSQSHAWMPEALLASPLASPLTHLSPDSDTLAAPWPDLLIGCGRVAAGLSLAMRRAAEKKGRKLVTVQTQNPRISPAFFDLVVPPAHDGLSGENVIPVLGAPNRVTPKRLEEEAKLWRPSVNNMPRPLVAVLIGGSSHAYEFTQAEASALCDQLLMLRADTGCGLAITASRRTGRTVGKYLRETLRGDGIWFWNDEGDNPYFGMLALADHIVVTSDSTNMVTEAAGTGKPIHVVHLPGGSKKFTRFHRAMETRGFTRRFDGMLESWTYEPLNEAARIAPQIRDLLGLNQVAIPAAE